MPLSDNNVAVENEVQNPTNPKFFMFLEGHEMLSLSVTRPRPKTAVTPESERAGEEQTETISLSLRANRDEPSAEERTDMNLPS
jgi:hypothetical protein